MGGGASTITHLGVVGARTVSTPAEAVTGGLFGVVWNIGEIVASWALALLAVVALFVGVAAATFFLFVLISVVAVLIYKAVQARPSPSYSSVESRTYL